MSVAFINKGGVDLIAGPLGGVAAKTSVFAGIRNEITSYQGLHTLLALDVSLYTVDTGARTPLFHPKLFYARGTNEARLVIGSANLTTGGLNNNIEAGVAITLDLGVSADRALADDIEAQLDALPGAYPKNVRHVVSTGELDTLRDSGLLFDESVAIVRKPIAAGKSPKSDKVPRIRLKVPFLAPTIGAAKKPARVPKAHRPLVGVSWEVVWQSKPLTERDLMTRLSWGKIKPLIALDTLRGRTMTLGRSTNDPARFLIDID